MVVKKFGCVNATGLILSDFTYVDSWYGITDAAATRSYRATPAATTLY